jgi:hypothetical protein
MSDSQNKKSPFRVNPHLTRRLKGVTEIPKTKAEIIEEFEWDLDRQKEEIAQLNKEIAEQKVKMLNLEERLMSNHTTHMSTKTKTALGVYDQTVREMFRVIEDAYCTSSIYALGTTFTLREEIRCVVLREVGLVVIFYPPLWIRAYAETKKEAVDQFNEEFALLYQEYALEDDAKLGYDAREIKRRLLKLIGSAYPRMRRVSRKEKEEEV